MSYTVNQVIKIAEAEVGYLEKASNSMLDSKTANAGDKNYTKYARDLAKAGYYQASKQGYAWCNVWFDWVHYMAAGQNAKLAQEVTCQTGPYGAACYYSMQYYKQSDRLYTSPKIGDQIFFKNSSGEIIHTGLVYNVDKSYVYTIEGNTSTASGVIANGGGVCKKKYKLNYERIASYGRPKYDLTQTVTNGGTCTMNLDVLKKGNKNNSVRALQILLIGNGYSCGSYGADGDFGTGTYNAVIKFQKVKNINADGIVGAQTWGKLLK